MEMLEGMGVEIRRNRTMYRKPYPEWFDRAYPFPRNYKIPEFTLFSGEEKRSTVEHVARFTVQCAEASGNDFFRLRLFGNSLTKTAFTWYTNLPAHSIATWEELEEIFHSEFFRASPTVTIADLAKMVQRQGETVEQFALRFRRMRTQCQAPLAEKDCVALALT